MERERILLGGVLAAVVLWGNAVGRGQPPDRYGHLVQAAEHLAAAGLPEKAAEIRRLAAEEAKVRGPELLRQKLAQLEQLQREIEHLQPTVAPVAQVRVALKLCEFSFAELEKSGFSLLSLKQLVANADATGLVDDSGKLSEFLGFLEKQGLLPALTCPVLVNTDGRPASVTIGDSQNAAAAAATGLNFECTPKIGSAGKLQLALRLRLRRPAKHADTAPAPALELNTKVELASGQTVIWGGKLPAGGGHEERGYVALVTGTVLNPVETFPPRATNP